MKQEKLNEIIKEIEDKVEYLYDYGQKHKAGIHNIVWSDAILLSILKELRKR